MRRPKRFDCVEMKEAIQARLLREREGMTDAEIRAQIQHTLDNSNSPVARLWRTIRSRAAAAKS